MYLSMGADLSCFAQLRRPSRRIRPKWKALYGLPLFPWEFEIENCIETVVKA